MPCSIRMPFPTSLRFSYDSGLISLNSMDGYVAVDNGQREVTELLPV